MISYLSSILKSKFWFSVEPMIFAFDFSIYLSIFGFWIASSTFDFSFDLSIKGRIRILVQSTSKNDIFNSPNSFGLSIDGFLISKLQPTLNEIALLFFFFSSDVDDSCFFLILIQLLVCLLNLEFLFGFLD
jgi:hypothetical protein